MSLRENENPGMSPVASLMMYLRPETRAAHLRWWSLIRAALMARDIEAPERLSNDADPQAIWTAPDLVLSQTCGMPYRVRLAGQVGLVATPDYGVAGCPPGYYRSVIVARSGTRLDALRASGPVRWALNDRLSQSGFAAPTLWADAAGLDLGAPLLTGAHQASVRAVAEGRADLAGIDAVTWRLLCRFGAAGPGLQVLDHTPPSPGLPLICGPHLDTDLVRAAVEAGTAELPDADRKVLGLRGIVHIPKSDYLAVPKPAGRYSAK